MKEIEQKLKDLETIYLMKRLNDHMRRKVADLLEYRTYPADTAIFEEGESADRFCMLITGKVLLNVEAIEGRIISLGSIKQGYSFGWSALRSEGDAKYTTCAFTAEPSEIFVVNGKEFIKLLEEDYEMGYRVMQGITQVLKGRLERRTNQFLRTLNRHIEMEGVCPLVDIPD